MIYNVISQLLMCFSGWRNFCREAWQKRYNYIQIDKNKDLDDMCSIKNVSGLEIAAVPETTAFQFIELFILTLNKTDF